VEGVQRRRRAETVADGEEENQRRWRTEKNKSIEKKG